MNKTILITGAAVGIGRSTAKILDSMGAKLVLVDINHEKLVELSQWLQNKNHSNYFFNFNEVEKIESLVERIVNENGKLDGFVNCVGIRSRSPLSFLKPEKLIKLLSINFVAVIEFLRCITIKDRFNEGISIVSVSSIASLRGSQLVTAYSASKAAVDAAFRCLAIELCKYKIRLNTVLPGQTNTPAYEDLMKMSSTGNDPVLQRQIMGLAEPDDIANVIVFLLSEKSSFITGCQIPVDGGFLVQ